MKVGEPSATSFNDQLLRSTEVSPAFTIWTYSSDSVLETTPSKKMHSMDRFGVPDDAATIVGVGTRVAAGTGTGVGVVIGAGTGVGTGVRLGVGTGVGNDVGVAVGVTFPAAGLAPLETGTNIWPPISYVWQLEVIFKVSSYASVVSVSKI